MNKEDYEKDSAWNFYTDKVVEDLNDVPLFSGRQRQEYGNKLYWIGVFAGVFGTILLGFLSLWAMGAILIIP